MAAVLIAAHPHFPAIWLRELADGGRHLDAETFTVLARIPDVLRRILDNGRDQGTFGAVHPQRRRSSSRRTERP